MNPTVVQVASSDDAHRGAAAFDALMLEVGKISAESYDRDGVEDYSAMVEAMRPRVVAAMEGNAAYQFGFLLPLVDLIEGHRLGACRNNEWTGAVSLRDVVRGVTQAAGNVSEISPLACLGAAPDEGNLAREPGTPTAMREVIRVDFRQLAGRRPAHLRR